MKFTKDQMGFILACGLWIRQIGWSFSLCSEKCKDEFPKVLKYWPGVCDFTMDDVKPKKKDIEEIKEAVDPCPIVEPPKRRRSRKVRAGL